jgi:hypothetical protein
MTLIADSRELDHQLDIDQLDVDQLDRQLDDADAGPVDTTGQVDADDREPTIRQILRPFWFVGALLMMLDGLTTYIALTYFAQDGAREGNPLGVWAIDQVGVAGMCTLKVLIGVLMMWRLAVAADRGHRFEMLNRGLFLRKRPTWIVRRNAAWTLAFSLFLMGVVVGNNVRAIIGLMVQ